MYRNQVYNMLSVTGDAVLVEFTNPVAESRFQSSSSTPAIPSAADPLNNADKARERSMSSSSTSDTMSERDKNFPSFDRSISDNIYRMPSMESQSFMSPDLSRCNSISNTE